MSGIDVRDLKNESLASREFPAAPDGDFRCYLSPEAKQGIDEHARANVSVEICGVLVGQWHVDDDGPYACVTDYIRCDNAASKSAEVTFTHDSWSQINEQMDSQFADKRIVGWYHSHPDFGIFLSERDCFIHEHFFSGPGQIALVVDPVRDQEGVFAWRDGKPTPLSHYWVGDQVRTGDADGSIATEPSFPRDTEESERPVASSVGVGPPLSTPAILVGSLLVFLLGYLYGGWRSRWEQEMIIQGAVAHFADTKLLRPGLEEQTLAIRKRLVAVADELEKLPPPGAELSQQQQTDAATRRETIRDSLRLSVAALARLADRYGLSEVERSAYARIIAEKQTELRRLIDDPKRAGDSQPKPKKGAPTPNAKQPTSGAPEGAQAEPDRAEPATD